MQFTERENSVPFSLANGENPNPQILSNEEGPYIVNATGAESTLRLQFYLGRISKSILDLLSKFGPIRWACFLLAQNNLSLIFTSSLGQSINRLFRRRPKEIDMKFGANL